MSMRGLRGLAVILPALLLVCCAGQSRRVEMRPVPGDRGAFEQLRAGIRSYEGGRFSAAGAAFDSLLALAAPGDSQLVFLGVYYGIRARLALQRDSSAAVLLERYRERVPGEQRPELVLVLRGEYPLGGGPVAEKTRAVARKLGVVLPLSGKYAEFGNALLEGVQLAVNEYNRGRAPGGQVLLESMDDRSDPARAGALGRRLAADTTVAAVIGSFEEETTMSLALAAAASQLPLLCPSAEAPGLDNLGPMVHVLNRADPELAASLARFAVRELDCQMIAVLAPNDERANSLARSFTEGVRQAGGSLVLDLRYPPETSTFNTEMNLMRRVLPDAIYLPARSHELTQLASQVHFYGLGRSQLLGTEQWAAERVIRIGGQYVEGAVFSSPFYEQGAGLRWEEFNDLYVRAYRRPVNRFSGLGYDAAQLALSAGGGFPVDRRALGEKLNRIADFHGAMAIYSIGPDGKVWRKPFILQLSGGSIQPAAGRRGATILPEQAPETGADAPAVVAPSNP